MHIKKNQLYFGKFSAPYLGKKFGTPLYVYEVSTIKRQYKKLVSSIAYRKLSVHYACKANTNISILKLLRRLGAKVETVSRGEIILALKAGFKPKDILYTSTSVSRDEIAFVARRKVMVNLDSLSQIKLYGEINPGSDVGIRINQGIGAGHHDHVITGGSNSKFGIPLEHMEFAQKLAKKYRLRIIRLHQHIGSNILDKKILLRAFDKLLETALNFKDLESLDFGGGFGIPYLPKEKELDVKGLGKTMVRKMKRFNKLYGKELAMILEPGRFLVAEAGVLLASVTEIKNNPVHTFVGVDTGFNHFVRPAMYGSFHRIINASKIKGISIKAHIVGNICESGDIFGKDRVITSPKAGDILAILDTGAYGYVMASRYNSRPLPLEVLVDK